MIELRRHTDASRSQVWDVLADAWLYAGWVVGASRIRDVDSLWPDAGGKIHHSVGSWPFLLNDETEVFESVADTRLVLLARTRPFGQARVTIELTDTEGSTDGRTEIVMTEDIVSGPARFVPSPVRQRALVARNRESLRRLAYIAEGRSR